MIQQFIFMVLMFSFVAAQSKTSLQRIADFGKNPRHLKMFVHQLQNIKPGMPVVIVLHGCTQNAKQCARLTGWNELADKNGFVVIYPEQRSWNNPAKCFNWFTDNNQTRDKGEAQSVRSMIAYAVKQYQADSTKIFITGLSAGGAMTTNMLAMYPEVFNAGSVFSGGAYRTAKNYFTSLLAMNGWLIRNPKTLGDFVHNAHKRFEGDYPRVAVFHGKNDLVVNRRNAKEIVKQWTNVHNTDEKPDSIIKKFSGVKHVTLSIYRDGNKKEVLRYFSIKRMGHAVATYPGKCPCNGGGRGIFSRNKHFFSTYHAADFFGLIQMPCEQEVGVGKGCK
jgi:poly(hydroxyalkanoate) depolymerase family esterase